MPTHKIAWNAEPGALPRQHCLECSPLARDWWSTRMTTETQAARQSLKITL